MVGRPITRLVIITIAIGYALPVSAGELGEFLSCMARDTKRRNCWPEPFVYPDRAAVRQTMGTQVCAGWERQNLLSEFHFLPGGNQLTEAGRLRVQWIMNEAPEHHRQVYVHRADTPQETAIRMQAVERFVAQSTYGGGPGIPVIESTRTDEGSPAASIVSLTRKADSSLPDPKLLGSSGGAPGGGGK